MSRRTLTVYILATLSLTLSLSASQRTDFLFLDEIEIGMTGIGKTIVADDVISEFDVDVLGVIDQAGDLSDFIVVRVSGGAIGHAGGIAQGMSGSPIYIDGKLIGALSRAAEWSKEITPIGLVTPIEPMLAIADSVASYVTAREEAILQDVALVEGACLPDDATIAAAPNTIFSAPVATPLLTSGLSDRGRNALMVGLSSPSDFAGSRTIESFLPATASTAFDGGLAAIGLSLLPLAAQGTHAAIPTESLEPGSGIGVALATGDVTIGALGTLTYRDGNTVVGFGHPFLSNGESAFPMTTVSIIDTMKTLDAPFKLGTLGNVIGTVLEDRTAAIGGSIGVEPTTIDVSVGVYDADQDQTQTFDIAIVNEPLLTPEILLASTLEAVDTALDRIGQGTVEMTIHVSGSGMPRALERRDIFLSTRDIAIYPALQLASLASYLQYNEFQDPEFEQVAVSMQVSKEIRAIRIINLELDAYVYAPGDNVLYRVTLQTYQGDIRTVEGKLAIPEDFLSDTTLVVRAYGGPRVLERGETPRVISTLAELLEAIEEIRAYDSLTIELFAEDPYSTYTDALHGVTEEIIEFPGYVIYDEWEQAALLLTSYESGEPDW